MTTYNTGNPIGSTDARDLYDNAQNLDNFANGTSASYSDRLGVTRRSLAGIEATADGVLNGIGYAVPVAYASGISMTLTSQTVDYNGVIYAPKSSALPFTTSSWGADSVKFRAIQVTDADLITYTPAGTGAVATTVQSKLRETVSVFDFMTAAQIADVQAGTLLVDVTAAVQAAITAVSGLLGTARGEVYFPKGRYSITGITLPSRVILSGHGELCPLGTGVAAITLTNTLYSAIYDVSINISQADQKAIRILGTGGSFSQLNNFYNVKIDSDVLPAGSVGIEIDNSFSNSFFGVNILRVAKQVTFANGANGNHFYGGELRSNNTNANGSNPIVQNVGCLSNGFHGTVIENQRAPILMEGGVLTIDSGCYIEAFTSASSIAMVGGNLRLIGNYLNNGFIFISGGSSISVKDNVFDGLLSNSGYPFIKFMADVATRLNCDGNQVLDTTTPGVLLRPRQYWTGSAFVNRSISNMVEFVQNKPVRFQARLVADRTDVTGDGTVYTVAFGNNEQFDDNSNFDGTTFTAPENGVYAFQVSLYLAGITASQTSINAKLVTSNRTYSLHFGAATASVSGEIVLNGSVLADMESGDTAVVTIAVGGSTKVVDVLRLDATSGYTTFSGFKVA